MTGRALVVRGNALQLPLPDECIDLIVSSPPYWALRDYQTPGQLGSEPTPQEFLANLWAATAEMVRVLKPTGSIFVDLGDKYCSGTSSAYPPSASPEARKGGTYATGGKALSDTARRVSAEEAGVPMKSLLLLPERYRIGCVDQLGLIARAVIVWDKPNGLPESVRDRVRRSHEDWVHLVKQPRYYSAIDEIRSPHAAKTLTHRGGGQAWGQDNNPDNNWAGNGQVREVNPLGALPGSVWSIPSEPLRLPPWLGVDHYAAFPSEWPRRLILGWSPPGICVECGQGRVPVVDRRNIPLRPGDQAGRASLNGEGIHGPDRRAGTHMQQEATILGYACACTPHTDHPGTAADRPSDGHYGQLGGDRRDNPSGGLWHYDRTGPWREYHLDGWRPPPTRPALVLDPFGGTGTTAMVARALGRYAVTVDLSADYCRASRWRIFQSGNAGKALTRTNLERQRSLL